MEYDFRKIEQEWQQDWAKKEVYKVSNLSSKPKYYVLDMFPYPSGTGLHVGHPLGYIASDIYARYKRLKGYNVLHPMGYDSFGLPAEQYALETGQHPAVTTEKNIATFRSQLDKIGFCFDWSREVKTSDEKYYKWTQWIFLQLFNSWFNRKTQKAESIDSLIAVFEKEGNSNISSAYVSRFTSDDWKNFSEKEKSDILMDHRLAFCGFGEVNWCEALGTVLANDEVVNGVSERGGYPVVKKKLRQWYLRITEYADRLLEGLQTVDFSDAMKEMQTNWIGKSYGAEIDFAVKSEKSNVKIFTVYTTRPDTIFGVDFMVVAPELEWIHDVKSTAQTTAVDEYIAYVKSRSDRERQAEKKISGCFTGAYAINPFNGKEIPIWISEYVLAGYGTGAIMAVPCGDERDYKFAQHFNIPVTNIIGSHFNGTDANPTKDALLENSDFLNGIVMRDAIDIVLQKIEAMGIGKRKVNYRMRDAAFSRQRYWGEPFPIVWKDGIAYPLPETELPLELPKVDKYSPGPDGEGPLANLKDWAEVDVTPNPSPKERGTAPHYLTSSPEQWKVLIEFAKENRKNSTEAEDILWQTVRNRKIKGYKFRRQHPVEGYIPDFVCLEKKLIVEIDGGYHNKEEQQKIDALRTQWLEENNYTVIRFTNDEMLKNFPQVIKKLEDSLGSAAPSPLERAGGEALRETNTMPGYAGSSWYFLRYMDPHNDATFCDRKVSDYWNQVDLYIGGTEHAVGHLLYSRMWTKVLHDLGHIGFDEPFRRLVNQGMITAFGYYVNLIFYKAEDKAEYHMYGSADDIRKNKIFSDKRYKGNFVEKDYSNSLFRLPYINKYLDSSNRITRKRFIEYSNEFGKVYAVPYDYDFIFSEVDDNRDNDYLTIEVAQEKMSKSKHNTENPNELVDRYGADTFRMYEMFLGPVEQSKPWDTKGIEGVHRFLRKLWRMFFDETKGKVWNTDKATDAELKVLHKTIKKIEEDTERFSFNTAVSTFMICVNELSDLKCNKKEVLKPVLILLTPYAPHIAEELWHRLGNNGTILDAAYPVFDAKYLVETSKEYPISINGKHRATINIAMDATQDEVEKIVLANDIVQKWLEGKAPKKIIFVKGKMVNVVI